MNVLRKLIYFVTLATAFSANAQQAPLQERSYTKVLSSQAMHNGSAPWRMKKASDVALGGETVSMPAYKENKWMPAIVPGTVLNTLVYNKVYPEPYYGLNNKISSNIIPDLATAGRDFYTYWFRTNFELDKAGHSGKKIWMQLDGINYRAEVWLNGNLVAYISGMFNTTQVDITDYAKLDQQNILAIKVLPIDVPGGPRTSTGKDWGATGEFRNGGNGEIGKNVTMLMSVGWDFTFLDGIRDRNTGIWKNISIFTTDRALLKNVFVRSALSNNYTQAKETISVEVVNPHHGETRATISGEIKGTDISFKKDIKLYRGEVKEVVFTPEEFLQLTIRNPRLWWPVNKGKPELYELVIKASINGKISDTITTRFGIREIISNTKTPDKSRSFYVNGKPIFIKGTNWIPEGMLRNSDDRTYAELRYSAQSGINLIRFWGGGITESDYFFQLCDELGIMIWQEFWLTGDTKHPADQPLYLSNVASTVKRIRNHPSLAYYVCSNESTEVSGIKELLTQLDGTRGYQMQSESDGVHDGSPYKQVNPMRHYENTASERGSRVDGFNPEYGAPCLPTVEVLREMMSEKDLWPINKEVWNYLDGGGFHLMTTVYTDMVNQYGSSKSIDEFAQKAQFVGAMNYRSIWEVWNYNKLNYGDRYCSGLLYWYHNSPTRQVCGRMWDWSLEPTAALYYSQNALQPLHVQFDYIKSTVSVVNDYLTAFNNYKVVAEVYDLNSKKVFSKESQVNIPVDGVNNDVFAIDFPANISNVHFIKLYLYNEQGAEVSQAFYWRSNSKYEGKKTLTGPTTSGFQDLKNLAPANVTVAFETRVENGKHFVDVSLKNTGQSISFFTQLQWLDAKGAPIRPSFYTDNFICLLPNESKNVTIETDTKYLANETSNLVIKGFNLPAQTFNVRTAVK